MYRFSNTVIGYLNLVGLLASIPIIGAGLWLARRSSSCEGFLQTPLLALGFVVLLVSLCGFVGACFNVAWALWLYLASTLLLAGALLAFTAFAFAVTSPSGAHPVPAHVYHEYRLTGYSKWLRGRVADPDSWRAIRRCLLGSGQCNHIAQWTALDYMQKDLTPIQSGCCKPPTACSYRYAASYVGMRDEDCYRWNNARGVLCYDCDSCKAGVLEAVRKDWHKISVLVIVVLVLLVGVYSIGCCAFRNARRSTTDYPHGENRMSKVLPRWDFYWWRRCRNWNDLLY